MAFELTKQQRAAVYDRGGCTLVSAAAGSGKTRVLVERLLARVEEEGAQIDRFLIITYTNAAAAELRGRIADELGRRIAQSPADRHLRRQATLLYHTQISTIHAFCMSLLREEGHLLGLDGDFRLCDGQEAQVLKLRALEGVLEQRYEELRPDSDFARLVDTMSAGRDDRRVAEIVLDIRERVRSHPDPEAWLDRQERAFELEGVTDAGETVWGRVLLDSAVDQAKYWRARLAEAVELTARDGGLFANYAGSIQDTAVALERFQAAAAEGWDAAVAALPIPFPPAGRKKVEDKAAAEQVKLVRSACKARMEKLSDTFSTASAPLLEDLRQAGSAMRGLFALVKDFERAYAGEKERRRVLDFSDLEHFAAQLLLDESGGPTDLARRWSERYDEVMVDEYQDTNAVQNAIFTAVSQNGRKLFLVGDVKQSIYRFRLADPTIFLEKYHSFLPHTQAPEGAPRRLVLSQNFRSRPQVLEAVNFVFETLMSARLGEVDYTADQALCPGAEFPPGEEYAAELEVLLTRKEESEDGEERSETCLLEARRVAARIREMVDGGFPVTQGEGRRRARWEDIAILLRAPGGVLHHYIRALGELEIPWQAASDGDFFAATEVSVAISLLEVVDNPRQDVALISALRSPVYAFSADQLARIRAGSKDTDFYTALERAAAGGDGACREFLSQLEALRFGAGDKSCWRLLWDLYDGTDLLGIFGAMSEGERRRENLLALAELARQFEKAGHKGLFGFLSYLARLKESGAALAPPQARRSGGVQILSIHKSKGLEFPVVFLSGLSRKFNTSDVQKPVLFHPGLGVGPKVLDPERMVEYPTLARLAVERQLRFEMLSEEMRVLYVAMTRAREKLIMTCLQPEKSAALSRLALEARSPAEPQALAACGSMGEWLLLTAMCRPEGGPLRALAGAAGEGAPCSGAPWTVRVVEAGAYQAPPPRRALTQREAEKLLHPDGDLCRRLSWRYPYPAAAAIPSKLTATQLKGRALDREVAEDTASRPDGPEEQARPRTGDGGLRTPRFAQEEFGLTAAQKGTAQHLAMQFIDFAHTDTLEEIRAQIQRMTALELLTAQQGQAVRAEKLLEFFTSPLGRQVRAAPALQREFKFSLLVDAQEYYPQAEAGEQVLLQGVVDCFFETAEGITVVDFKTDRVEGESVLRRAEAYRPQLEVYSRALEEILGRQVTRRVLWFFHCGSAVEV